MNWFDKVGAWLENVYFPKGMDPKMKMKMKLALLEAMAFGM